MCEKNRHPLWVPVAALILDIFRIVGIVLAQDPVDPGFQIFKGIDLPVRFRLGLLSRFRHRKINILWFLGSFLFCVLHEFGFLFRQGFCFLVPENLLFFHSFLLPQKQNQNYDDENHCFRNANDPPGEGLMGFGTDAASLRIGFVLQTTSTFMEMHGAVTVKHVVMGYSGGKLKVANRTSLVGGDSRFRARNMELNIKMVE